MGGCPNYGPFLDTLNLRCRIIIGIQKGTIISTTTHMYVFMYMYTYVYIYICICIYVGSLGFRDVGSMRSNILGFVVVIGSIGLFGLVGLME